MMPQNSIKMSCFSAQRDDFSYFPYVWENKDIDVMYVWSIDKI